MMKKRAKFKKNLYAKSLGFGTNDYNFMSNSCVDYVWKALEIAGYNQEQFEGKLVPMFNCQRVQKITPNSISFTIQPLILNRDDLFTLFDTRFNSDTLLFNFNILQNTVIQPQSTTQISPTPQQTKDSSNSTSSNNLAQTPNTFPFQLHIKDYNTFTPLSNKQIQITNIDSKQTYTQTTDSRGLVSFEIKESERKGGRKIEV